MINNNKILKKEQSPEKNIGLLTIVLLFSLGMMGCAQHKSTNDSLNQYKQIRKTLGPVHSEEPINQNYIQTDLYSISPQSTPRVVFEVGKQNVLRINTALHLPGTSYKLVSYDLPQGAEQPQFVNGIWELKWTPSADLMAIFKSGTIKRFHLKIEITDTKDLRSKEIAKNLAAETAIDYTLEFPKTTPEIVAIQGIAKFPDVTRLNEGELLPLTIRVKDESASNSQKPLLLNPLDVDKFHDKESVINGGRFFILSGDPTPVKGQPGLWDFKAVFNTKIITVPVVQSSNGKPLPKTIMSNLILQAKGANDKLSTETLVSFEITYRQELLRPVFKTNKPELEQVAQTSKYTWTFESFLPSHVGTMTTYLADTSVLLSGSPKLAKCKILSKSPFRHQCSFSWTIPCSQPVGPTEIKIISVGDDNGQSSSTEFVKKLNITENKKCNPTPKESKQGDKNDKK